MVIFGFEGQNLGTLLENKVHLELKLWKYVNIKSWAPFFIFFNEKQIGKIPSIFDIEKWLWKSESPYIWPSKAKQTKGLEFLYTHQVEAEAKLIHSWAKLSCLTRLTHDSYIGFTLKIECLYSTIFGLKMTVKSGLEKFILKSLQDSYFYH